MDREKLLQGQRHPTHWTLKDPFRGGDISKLPLRVTTLGNWACAWLDPSSWRAKLPTRPMAISVRSIRAGLSRLILCVTVFLIDPLLTMDPVPPGVRESLHGDRARCAPQRKVQLARSRSGKL